MLIGKFRGLVRNWPGDWCVYVIDDSTGEVIWCAMSRNEDIPYHILRMNFISLEFCGAAGVFFYV